ncbi:MAG: hypothetical protein Q7U04_10575, partial [Bacteriovorax sp.]|nr:hypothetical protein [Bacteriovorax sp.]
FDRKAISVWDKKIEENNNWIRIPNFRSNTAYWIKWNQLSRDYKGKMEGYSAISIDKEVDNYNSKGYFVMSYFPVKIFDLKEGEIDFKSIKPSNGVEGFFHAYRISNGELYYKIITDVNDNCNDRDIAKLVSKPSPKDRLFKMNLKELYSNNGILNITYAIFDGYGCNIYAKYGPKIARKDTGISFEIPGPVK